MVGPTIRVDKLNPGREVQRISRTTVILLILADRREPWVVFNLSGHAQAAVPCGDPSLGWCGPG